MATDSYLAEMEEMQDMVAQSLYEDELAILDALAPNGVPFGMQDHVLNTNAQLANYLTTFKDNWPAQQAWIQQRTQESVSQLEAAGIPVEVAATWDARVTENAMEAALFYSFKMERLLLAHQKRNK